MLSWFELQMLIKKNVVCIILNFQALGITIKNFMNF